MKAAVRAQFDLGQEWDDGRTLRDHLQAAEAATGRTPARLQTPQVPDCFDRHLSVWLQLHERRQVGMAGLQPLSWPDLAAYTTVTGERLSREDLHFLNVIEGEFFASHHAAQERRAKSTPPPPRPAGGSGNGQSDRTRR